MGSGRLAFATDEIEAVGVAVGVVVLVKGLQGREAVTCHVDISTWQAEMDRGSDRVIDPGSHTSLLYICPRKAVTAILLPASTRA